MQCTARDPFLLEQIQLAGYQKVFAFEYLPSEEDAEVDPQDPAARHRAVEAREAAV